MNKMNKVNKVNKVGHSWPKTMFIMNIEMNIVLQCFQKKWSWQFLLHKKTTWQRCSFRYDLCFQKKVLFTWRFTMLSSLHGVQKQTILKRCYSDMTFSKNPLFSKKNHFFMHVFATLITLYLLFFCICK